MFNQFIKLLGKDEVILWEGAYSPLFILFKWNNQKYFSNFYKTPASPIFEIIEGKKAMLLFNGSRYAAYAKETFVKYWNDTAAFEEQFEKCKTITKQIEKKYKDNIILDLSRLDEIELIKVISESHDLLAELVATSTFIELFDKNSIINAVSDVNQILLDNVWERATHPAFESFEIRQLKFVINEFENRPNLFSKTCQFIYTDYFNSKTDDEVVLLLSRMVNEEELLINKQKIVEYAGNLKGRVLNFNIWLESLTSIEIKLVKYIQLVMEARDWRKDPIAQAQNMLFVLGKELLRRANIDDEFVQYVLPIEYEQGVKSLKNNVHEIIKRANGMAAFVDTNSKYQIVSINIKELKKEIYRISVGHEDRQSLKGQIGASGKATGVVKVVKDMSEASKFKNGDILVTGMTRPEFVPLMKMAAAIVTNEGGITCHAAIIARELHKPCIIGTKVATQVLKDGDTVVVDANIGVVNIIK